MPSVGSNVKIQDPLCSAGKYVDWRNLSRENLAIFYKIHLPLSMTRKSCSFKEILIQVYKGAYKRTTVLL